MWSLRANTAALTLPFKPEMRPLFGLDPDKASWKGADLSTESGRAWVAAVNELKSLGVLQSAVRSRESCNGRSSELGRADHVRGAPQD